MRALSQDRSEGRTAPIPAGDDASRQPLRSPGAEEALYDIQSMRTFCGLELGRDAIPDETTILNFRHLFERHALTKAIFRVRVAMRKDEVGRDIPGSRICTTGTSVAGSFSRSPPSVFSAVFWAHTSSRTSMAKRSVRSLRPTFW